MGLDLTALASHFRERRGQILSTESLRFDRDLGIMSLLSRHARPCLVRPLPEGLKVGHYEDGGLQYDDKDRYGNPLRFTTPELVREMPALDDLADWNRAILVFLVNLPPGTRIVLYWS